MRKNRLLKKLGVTASMAAVFGLVSSGVFITTTNLAGAHGLAQTAIEAPAEAGASLEVSTISADPMEADGGIITTDVSVTTEGTDTRNLTIPEVTQMSMPAMVAITNTTVQEIEDYFGGFGGFGFGYGFGGFGPYEGGNDEPQTYESVSMGSGVIINETDDQLIIATNAHVIEGATTLSVAFVDDTAAAAQILGSDTNTDLAVIAVNKEELSEETLNAIRIIDIGSSDDLVVGESVVAIGNALGYGQSVSAGIVSALGRELVSSDGSTEGTEDGLIQTDAAINPGNSGGALLNMQGELIGINSAKYASTEVEGMGYAIPITPAMEILNKLAAGESVAETPEGSLNNGSGVRLGISCTSITEDYANYYGLPTGVYVKAIEAGSAADAAGMEEGDIITELDGKTIASVDDLTSALTAYEPGDTAEVTVMREAADEAMSRLGRSTLSYTAVTLQVTFGEDEALQQTSVSGILQ